MKLLLTTAMMLCLTLTAGKVTAAESAPEQDAASGYCAGLEDSAAIAAEMVKLINQDPSQAVQIFNACGALDKEQLMTLLDAAMKAAPGELAALLTAAIESSEPAFHEALFQIALNNGLDQEEALIAALLGGADPTALADATAAGGNIANTNFTTPAPQAPGIGGAGGGSGSVSGN